MREERKPHPAPRTMIPPLPLHDLFCAADGTHYVLPEYDAPEIFPNLRVRRYLIEMVHSFHDTEACAN